MTFDIHEGKDLLHKPQKCEKYSTKNWFARFFLWLIGGENIKTK